MKKNENSIQISFINTGNRITPEQISIIFNPLTQLDELEENLRDKISMGLPFASHVIRAHGGKIKIDTQFYDIEHKIKIDVTLPT